MWEQTYRTGHQSLIDLAPTDTVITGEGRDLWKKLLHYSKDKNIPCFDVDLPLELATAFPKPAKTLCRYSAVFEALSKYASGAALVAVMRKPVENQKRRDPQSQVQTQLSRT